MGKSSKKSATKVEAVVPAGKALKNGNKREAEESPAKVVSAKKLKTNEGVKQAIVKEKVEKKTQKKKQESSSSEEESSEEEEEVKPAKQNGKQAPKKVETKVQKKQESSSSEEESSEEDSPDEEPAKKPQAVAAPAKKAESSDESDDSSSEEEDDTPVPAKAPVAVTKKKADSSVDESDESSSENDEPTPTAKKAPVAAAQKKPDSSSDEDSDESSEDEPAAPAAKAVPVKVSQKKAESSDDDSDDSSSEDDKKTAKVVAAPKKMDVDGSDDDSSEESDESGSEEESDDDKTTKTPKKTATDTVMVDAVTPKSTKQSDFKKTPNTPATPENAGSKTLFVGNLPFDIERADVELFFKDCGEVVDVRFSMNEDQRPKGFGHVEFATVEAAQKAIELNGQMLGGRDVRLDFARERGARPAYSGNEGNSFQKGGYGGESKKLFVRGFDTSSGEDEIRNQLTEYFGKCGEVANISIPSDYETGAVKGMAYVEFSDADAISKALELNGSDYTVEEARPRNRDGGGGRSGGRGDYSGGGGRRGGGGRFGGGGGGRFGSGGGGRFGSGGRGDSGGRGRGRGFSGGRGGRGTPRPSSFAMASGKKTTFDD